MIDFQNSYITWLTTDNSYGRFNIESVLNVFDSSGILLDTFVTICGVVACNVYGPYPLFIQPPFLFQAIISKSKIKIFRLHHLDRNCDSFENINDKFIEIKTNIIHINEKTTSLSNFIDISDAVLNNKSIIGQTIIQKEKLMYELIYPVKHINISLKKKSFQVETGVIGYVDFNNHDNISCHDFYLIYIAFKDMKNIAMIFNQTFNITLFHKSRFYKKVNQYNCITNLFSTE